MTEEQIQPSRVVIERRGERALEWSTEDGLRGIQMAPFGVVGVFEGKEMTQQMVSWYEISKFTIFDLDFKEPEENLPVQMCEECKGTGLTHDGDVRCVTCDGYGHVRQP